MPLNGARPRSGIPTRYFGPHIHPLRAVANPNGRRFVGRYAQSMDAGLQLSAMSRALVLQLLHTFIRLRLH